MAVNKLLVFDPNDINILDDAAYLASAVRQSGNAPSTIASAETINKALKQGTTAAAVLGEIAVLAGDNADDVDSSVLLASIVKYIRNEAYGGFSAETGRDISELDTAEYPINSPALCSPLLGTTYVDHAKIKIVTPGMYLINYDIFGYSDAGLLFGVMLNNVIQIMGRTTCVTSVLSVSISSSAILTLVKDDVITIGFKAIGLNAVGAVSRFNFAAVRVG